MAQYLAFVLALAGSSALLAQSSAPSSETQIKHYRFTVTINSDQGMTNKQSFMLDVPVSPGKMGSARAVLTAASEGDPQSVVQQLLVLSDVHASTVGIEMHIAMQSEREAPAIPGLVLARHQHGEFQRTVDLQLGKPTVVTQEMHFYVLGNTDPALAEKLRQPSPTVTVTADAT